jgi:hypothetical protein
MLSDSEYLICRLRNWHLVDNPKSRYELWEFESAWTSDALIVRPLADWPDEPGEELAPMVFGEVVLDVEDGVATIVEPKGKNEVEVVQRVTKKR